MRSHLMLTVGVKNSFLFTQKPLKILVCMSVYACVNVSLCVRVCVCVCVVSVLFILEVENLGIGEAILQKICQENSMK